MGVEAVFEGAAPGYELKKTAQADETADADAEAALTWRQVAASFPSSPKDPHHGAPAADKRPRDLRLWAASQRGLRFSMSRETPKLNNNSFSQSPIVGVLHLRLFPQFFDFFPKRFMRHGPYPRQHRCGV